MKKLQLHSKTSKLVLTVVSYGLVLAALTVLLKTIEYKYFIRDYSPEIYIGIIATICTALGIWIGLKIVDSKKEEKPSDETINTKTIEKLGISKREYEVLELISKGYSNQEIADALFISLPTVKTHSSNLFLKLDVKRRTQAVKKAKEMKIILFR